MCIFAFPVESVSNTRIAIMKTPNNLQLTVYENSVATSVAGGNVMILPVPNRERVEMVDLSQIGWSWSEIDTCYFPQNRDKYPVAAAGFSFGMQLQSNAPLPVTRCGGYDVSYAPTLQDMARINASVFVLPKDIETVLKTHYGQGFGFVVCKFKPGRTAGHPIAYTHGTLENGTLFIPTRHEHGATQVVGNERTVHDGVRCDSCDEYPIQGLRWKCQTCPDFDFCDDCFKQDKQQHRSRHFFACIERPLQQYNLLNQFPKNDHLDFDHTIYLFNCVLQAGPRAVTKSKFASLDKLTRLMPAFLRRFMGVANILSLQRVEIKADHIFNMHQIRNDDYYAAAVLQ